MHKGTEQPQFVANLIHLQSNKTAINIAGSFEQWRGCSFCNSLRVYFWQLLGLCQRWVPSLTSFRVWNAAICRGTSTKQFASLGSSCSLSSLHCATLAWCPSCVFYTRTVRTVFWSIQTRFATVQSTGPCKLEALWCSSWQWPTLSFALGHATKHLCGLDQLRIDSLVLVFFWQTTDHLPGGLVWRFWSGALCYRSQLWLPPIHQASISPWCSLCCKYLLLCSSISCRGKHPFSTSSTQQQPASSSCCLQSHCIWKMLIVPWWC